jgi:hypothetical protein
MIVYLLVPDYYREGWRLKIVGVYFVVLRRKPLIIYYFNARSFKVAGELQPTITVMQGLRNWMFMQLHAGT